MRKWVYLMLLGTVLGRSINHYFLPPLVARLVNIPNLFWCNHYYRCVKTIYKFIGKLLGRRENYNLKMQNRLKIFELGLWNIKIVTSTLPFTHIFMQRTIWLGSHRYFTSHMKMIKTNEPIRFDFQKAKCNHLLSYPPSSTLSQEVRGYCIGCAIILKK